MQQPKLLISAAKLNKRLMNSRRFKSTFLTALETASQLVKPQSWLKDPLLLVSNEMKTISKDIIKVLGSGHPILNRAANYYFESDGKRIRPMLVLLLSRAISEIPVEKRTRIKIDYKDIEYLSAYKLPNPTIKTSNSFTPLHLLSGINPLSPLTKGTESNNVESDLQRGILPKQRKLAEIIEMIHTASLLHDDVIDQSPMRRGKPSVDVAFSNKMAVLAGDFILARAMISVSRLNNSEITEILANAIGNLVEGEFMQMKNTVFSQADGSNKEGNTKSLADGLNSQSKSDEHMFSNPDGENVSHKTMVETAFEYYLNKTYLKTAALISTSCRAAAILSGAHEDVIEQSYEFGKNLGICFQLVDDMLDYTASEEHLGKPAGADLSLGLATAPALYAWKEEPSLGLLIQRNFSQPGDPQRMIEAVIKYNGVNKTRELAREYRDKALMNLREVLPESDSRAALEFLTNSILTRSK
ncbi:HER004Wp [Eremothecium sinecaudum]|uniref:HER004Wp n=1 Tax=Eremothecium sinecaudum TaxID=45286 RepID=A0A109UZC2_9SACH|nr:HER004Wp [Eremothecium sinecaudum]AMD21283.1 HER004Wp [Eremothecium sinecaudum]